MNKKNGYKLLDKYIPKEKKEYTAFESYMLKHKPLILASYIQWQAKFNCYGKHEIEQEDMVNEIMTIVSICFKKGKDRLYLKNAIHNKGCDLIDYWKAKKRKSRILIEPAISPELELCTNVDLIESLESLKPKERDALIGNFFHGYTIKHMAKQYSCTEKTIYNRIERAKKQIKNKLEAK